MKKIVTLVAMVMILGTSSVAKADAGDTILLYIPNRIVDFMDIFSVTLGFGPAVGVEVQATKYLGMGGEVGPTVQMIKGVNRQYGFAKQSGWDASFLMISAERRDREGAMGSVKDFYYYSTGVPTIEKDAFDFHKGALDFWACGGKLAALIEVQGYIHPIEIADFFTGWFFYDLKDDDFTADDLDQ